MLIAVSGGADSVALLHAAAQLATTLKMRIGGACIDHGLRSRSAAEVEFVRSLCATLSVPFFTRTLRLEDGADLEARARAARYSALEALRVEGRFDLIATAHTADDQAETLLMRLGRGTSLRGLSAIRERNGNVLRPVLSARRVELREYIHEHQLSVVEDPMNSDPRFTRVRVRQRLLPAFDSLFPAGVAATVRLANHAAEDEEVLAQLADAAFDRLLLDDGAIDTEGLLALLPGIRRRVVRSLLEDAGIEAEGTLIDEALGTATHGGQLTLPHGAYLRVSSGATRVVSASRLAVQSDLPLRPGEWISHEASGLQIGVDVDGGTWEARAVSTELSLSSPKPGDRMAFGGGKLQDVLVDLRIPREARSELPLIRGADSRVVCVAGLVRGGQAGEHRVVARLAEGRAAPRWVGRYRVTH